MTLTVIGQLATHRGLAEQYDLAGTPDPFTLPANQYRHLQPAHVPVRVGHDAGFEVGEVAYLERSRADGLLTVMRADNDDIADLLDDGDWYLSAGVNCRPTGQPLEFGLGLLSEVSLVRKTANLGTSPVRWSRSDIATDSGSHPHGLPLRWHDTWDRAHQALQRRRHGYRRSDSLFIVDLDPLPVTTEPQPKPTPKPAVVAVRRTRADAARFAGENGLDGYDYVGPDGQRRHVRSSGTLLSVD